MLISARRIVLLRHNVPLFADLTLPATLRFRRLGNGCNWRWLYPARRTQEASLVGKEQGRIVETVTEARQAEAGPSFWQSLSLPPYGSFSSELKGSTHPGSKTAVRARRARTRARVCCSRERAIICACMVVATSHSSAYQHGERDRTLGRGLLPVQTERSPLQTSWKAGC